ncbi:hypothetical protein ACF0H5_008333 [Mactra antiquata]
MKLRNRNVKPETPKTQKKSDETDDCERYEAAERVENELLEIKDILMNVLTKNDPSLRTMIENIVKDMKDELLNSLNHRINVLESEKHLKDLENDKLKKEIDGLRKTAENQTDEFKQLKNDMEKQAIYIKKRTNDLEHYQRRNNIRISGLKDVQRETAEQTAYKVVENLNK